MWNNNRKIKKIKAKQIRINKTKEKQQNKKFVVKPTNINNKEKNWVLGKINVPK